MSAMSGGGMNDPSGSSSVFGHSYEISRIGRLEGQSRIEQTKRRLDAHADASWDLSSNEVFLHKEQANEDSVMRLCYQDSTTSTTTTTTTTTTDKMHQPKPSSVVALSKPLPEREDPTHLIRSTVEVPVLHGDALQLSRALGFGYQTEVHKTGHGWRIGSVQITIFRVTHSTSPQIHVTSEGTQVISIVDQTMIQSKRPNQQGASSLTTHETFTESTRKLGLIQELLRGLVDLERG